MKWLKRIAIAFAALLLVVTAVLWWVLGTGAGLRFALARAESLSGGALQVRQAQGRLVGPLQLSGVRYDDGHGTVVELATVRLDLHFWSLLGKRVHLTTLDVAGVAVALPAASTDESASSGNLSLHLPVELIVDRVHVGPIKVAQAGKDVFAADRLDLAGRWTDRGIELRQLALRAPDGHANLAGELVFGPSYQGSGTLGFAWNAGDTDVAGTLSVHSDGKLATLDAALTAPAPMKLHIELAQTGEFRWKGKLETPRFNPVPLLGEGALQSLALSLSGHGDRHGGTLEGQLDLNRYRVLLQPLRARFDPGYHTLTLEQLGLGSPQFRGNVEASGTVQLDARPLAANLQIGWSDLQLPAELVGQVLASRGQLKASGSVDAYRVQGDLELGPPGKPAQLSLELDGTPQSLQVRTFELKQAKGQLQASGQLILQPALAWQAEVRATAFDPGQLLAHWEGALDADIASRGQHMAGGLDATLEIRKLAGNLRKRAISGHGELHLSPQQVLDGRLELASGASSLQLTARPGTSNDAELQLAIASLGDWLPDAGGRLDGHLRIQGKLPKLSINGQLHGQSLAWQQQRAQRLRLIVGLPDISRLAGKLDLQLGDAIVQGLAFQDIHALAEGSQASHRLDVQARGTQLSGVLDLRGTLNGSRWSGTLSTLNLEPQGLPPWRLQHATQLGYDDGAMQLAELCLTAGDPLLCASARRDKAGNLDASYRLQALPLALLLNAAGEADLPLRAEGNLDGSGKIHRSAAGALSGHASLGSTHGAISYTDDARAPLLRYDHLQLDAELAPQRQQIDLHAALDHGGRIDGQLGITGAQQALSGQVELHLGNLAFVELLSHELANVRGRADARVQFAGSLAQPRVIGQAELGDFAAEIPAAGLTLAQGQLHVTTLDGQQLQIRGSVHSGKGSVAVDGSAGLGGTRPTRLTVKGSEFTAVDIPAASVVLSPDLVVQQGAAGIDITGAVSLDRARVNVDKLPGAGASAASPDVVVVDAKQPQDAAGRTPLNAVVKVDLGEQTHITGLGLDGRVSGVLTVIEKPGRATVGQGQIAVNGTYRAYGQDLKIQRGQLLFASTPIDNPGLNIRAVRKLNPNATIDEGQEVGLYVAGTAQRPILTVFSNPVMEQSDALSYLITGKPLSEVKGGEGSMVSAAAQALGSAAGDLLAKRIGSQLGLDDIGVSSNEALGGSSAFTVGKYLSPRLYLSYGVGLFEPGEVITLRYRLSKRWNLEAQQATDFSRASLNYRLER
ncbi:MAG: translocation/assembly module TamB domain-containing protein [Rhodanobacter sp.]